MEKLLGDLDIDNSEALSEFITTKRNAEQAVLTEVDTLRLVAEEKLRTAEARKAQAGASL